MTISQQTTSPLDTTREAVLTVYEYYDQERGMPCVPPPMQVVQENRARKNLHGARLLQVAFEEL